MINNYTDVHVVLNFCLRKEKVVFNQRNKYVVYQTGGPYQGKMFPHGLTNGMRPKVYNIQTMFGK